MVGFQSYFGKGGDKVCMLGRSVSVVPTEEKGGFGGVPKKSRFLDFLVHH